MLYIHTCFYLQIDGYSLETQKERLRREAKHRGMFVVGEYGDEGKDKITRITLYSRIKIRYLATIQNDFACILKRKILLSWRSLYLDLEEYSCNTTFNKKY